MVKTERDELTSVRSMIEQNFFQDTREENLPNEHTTPSGAYTQKHKIVDDFLYMHTCTWGNTSGVGNNFNNGYLFWQGTTEKYCTFG